MPTYEWAAAFGLDWKKLTRRQQSMFLAAITHLVDDIRAGGGFRKGLRVKKMSGHHGLWEMTWDGDGRAVFEYGPPARDGMTHIRWRRIGTHEIFKNP